MLKSYATVLIVLLLCLTCLGFVPKVKAAWLSGWGKRVQIDIDSGDIDNSLSSFPVLIYLTNSTSGIYDEDVSFIFDEIGNNYLKLAVTVGEDTQTFVEVESWSGSAEIGILWANVTAGQSVNTTLYLYYDITHANNTAYVDVTGTGNSVNVWDSNFQLVWHMDDNTTSTVAESTSNDRDGTKTGANEPIETTGQIDRAQAFDGTNDHIDDAKLNMPDYITMEAWVYFNSQYQSGQGNMLIIQGISDYSFWFKDADGKLRIADDAGEVLDSTKTVWAATTWFHIVGILDDVNEWKRIYIDGTEDINDNTAFALANTQGQNLRIGERYQNDFEMLGRIDEVRISNIVRSAAWIKASYESEIDDLLDFGSEEIAAIYTVTFYNNTGGILRVNNVTTANGTETEYANNTEIELIAIVEGNLTYGFDNFTWNGNYNYSNPYNWTITYAASNLTLWCYFGAFGAGDITEERAFGTLGFVVAVIAVAIGAAVLGKKLL